MPTPDLEQRFTYHPPRDGQPERYAYIRAKALEFARTLDGHCPDSREKSLALTKLEECVMHANAAIARNEPSPQQLGDAGFQHAHRSPDAPESRLA